MNQARKWAKKLFLVLMRIFGLNAIHRMLNRGQIKIILYHRIEDFAAFESQLDHFQACFNMVSLNEQGNWSGVAKDKPNLLITFDDGFDTDQLAGEILYRRGIKACFFLIARCLPSGSPPPFILERGGGSNGSCKTLNPQQAKQLISLGHTIGCHSLRHDNYSQMASPDALQDALTAAREIHDLLSVPVTIMAFPWGHPPSDGTAAFASAFKKVLLTEHGFNDPGAVMLRRNEVTDLLHAEAAASGSLDWARNLLISRIK